MSATDVAEFAASPYKALTQRTPKTRRCVQHRLSIWESMMPSTRNRRFLPLVPPELASLAPAPAETPPDIEDDDFMITDGPFAETKEVMLGG